MSLIVETLARVRQTASFVNVTFGIPDGAEWQSYAALLTDEVSVERWLATIRHANHTTDRHYQGVTLVGAAWLPITAVLSALYTAERVPIIAPEQVWLHFSEYGFLDAVMLATTRYFALESDVEAQNDPNATLFPTFEALRDAARQQIEVYSQPLIELAYRKTSFGRRAGWSTVADRCAQTIITALKRTGCGDQAENELKAFLNGSPMQGKTGVLWVDKDDQCEPFLGRGACCLSYKLPSDYGYCSTCPLLSIEERRERLRPHMG